MTEKEMAQIVAIWFTTTLLCVAIAAYSIGRSVGVSSVPTKEAVIQGLSYDERQAISVQFMCSEHQWKGVETFCGSQVFDSDNKETTK